MLVISVKSSLPNKLCDERVQTRTEDRETNCPNRANAFLEIDDWHTQNAHVNRRWIGII